MLFRYLRLNVLKFYISGCAAHRLFTFMSKHKHRLLLQAIRHWMITTAEIFSNANQCLRLNAYTGISILGVN